MLLTCKRCLVRLYYVAVLCIKKRRNAARSAPTLRKKKKQQISGGTRTVIIQDDVEVKTTESPKLVGMNQLVIWTVSKEKSTYADFDYFFLLFLIFPISSLFIVLVF